MDVISRIRRPNDSLCDIIELSEGEKKIYEGCGWHIAHFENGRLAALFNPLDVPYTEDIENAANEVYTLAVLWMKAKKGGEFCLVMCSGYELCQPEMLDITDAGRLAFLGRRIGEILLETE